MLIIRKLGLILIATHQFEKARVTKFYTHRITHIYGSDLLLLASEVPNTPAHVLEPGASLAGVAGGNHLNPRPVQISLIDSSDHLLHKVLSRIKMPPVAQIYRRRRLMLFNSTRPTIQYRLQVPINPFVSGHYSTIKSASAYPLYWLSVIGNAKRIL